MKAQTFLNLFCGCGGFTLGMIRGGLRCLAAVDVDPSAIATLRANLIDRHRPGLPDVAHALKRDLTKFKPDQLAALIGTEHVDVVVGGPPCLSLERGELACEVGVRREQRAQGVAVLRRSAMRRGPHQPD